MRLRADVNAMTNQNETIFDCALDLNLDKEIIDVLKMHGARFSK